jgi:hypothetical protein
LIDGHSTPPLWDELANTLLSNHTKFPYVYSIHHSHIMECEPSSFTSYDVLTHTKLYRQSVQLWHDIPAPSYILLFSMDRELANKLLSNKCI